MATILRTQHNARIHLGATLGVTLLGLSLSLSVLEWSAVVLSVGLVWIAEALNTSLEFLADKVSQEHHELIKSAKDVAAAGVLFAAVTALLVGLLIFVPHGVALTRR